MTAAQLRAVARSCSRLILPPQYPSVARFNSRGPQGGKPKFERCHMRKGNLRVLSFYGTWHHLPQQRR